MSNKGGVDYSQHHIEIDLHNQKLKIMKLISNPTECGYCDQTKNYRDTVCKHPKIIGLRICNYSTFDKITGFPNNCPLQDGIVREKECFTDLCPYLDQKIPLIPKYKTDTPAIMIKRLKRRSRKNCIYGYIPNKKGKLPLHCKHKDILYPHCQGVTCGHFEPKTE